MLIDQTDRMGYERNANVGQNGGNLPSGLMGSNVVER